MRLASIAAVVLLAAGCNTNFHASGGSGGAESDPSAGRPANSQSARETCREAYPDAGDGDSLALLTVDAFVETTMDVVQTDADAGFTRSEEAQLLFADCEEFSETQQSAEAGEWCVVCAAAIVDEVYDNYVPISGARGVCRRATLPDDNIDGLRSLIQVMKDEGYTKAEFMFAISGSSVCRESCSANDNLGELWTFADCVAGCTTCLVALAEEVW